MQNYIYSLNRDLRRLETPHTPSREPMRSREEKSIKPLTALQEFVAPSRPSQRQNWALQSRAATAARHTIPQTLLFPTIKLPKPPLKWVSTNKFHPKETNRSFCAVSCSTNVPFRVAQADRQQAETNWSVPPFMSWQLWWAVRVKDCLPRNPRHSYLWSDYIYFISPVSYCMATTDTLAEPQGCNRYLNKDTSRLLNGSVHRKQI